MTETCASLAGRRPPTWTRARPALALAAVLLALPATAGAGMLDAESCRRIKTDYDALAASGIRGMMAKGPEWAKANLTKERMEQIKRYLALEEDVRFRCPLGKARPELEAAESEAGAATPLQADENAPAATAPPVSKTARKPKPAAAQQQADAPADPAAGETAKPKAAAKTGQPQAKPAAAKPRTAPAAEKAQPQEQGDARPTDIGAAASEPARKPPR